MGKTRATMAPGDVIAGRYRIDGMLGQGGFGVVFRATQLPIGRGVALKMLLDEALGHADARARFRREAELAQRLEHPNTVRLYDFGETEDGLPFIAWELLKGRPLDAVIAAEGPLPPARAGRIAAQILKALMEAHGMGIVHRDIKPSNVLLCEFSGERDFVKVLDFGIAKRLLTRGTGLTPEGSILGTPAYMAPEQVAGTAVSPASDLYSLGLLVAEMITGKPVFDGPSAMDVIAAQLAERPTPLAPEVLASPLGRVIARATERSPDRRYPSAAEMLRDLEAAGVPSTPSPTTLATAPTSSQPITPAPASIALAPTGRALVPAIADTALVTVPPRQGASRRTVALAAVAGAVLAGGATVGGLYAAGVFDDRAAAVRPGGRASTPASARSWGGLDDKQIRARIEAARYKVKSQETTGWTTTWMLTGEGINYVQVIRYGDSTAAEAPMRELLKQPGAAAEEGGTVLYVRLAQPAASKGLLAQIAP
jgi:serine/threonine-protein kinase